MLAAIASAASAPAIGLVRIDMNFLLNHLGRVGRMIVGRETSRRGSTRPGIVRGQKNGSGGGDGRAGKI
jgi:hypothetical protein